MITADFKILVGDINLDILRTSVISNIYLDLLAEFGYFKMNDTITRYASNSCLDHIFMKSKTTKFSNPIVCQITISGHYPIFLSIGNLISNRNNTSNALTITTIDYSLLSNLIITKQSWISILEYTDCNDTTKLFFSILNNLIELAFARIKVSS